jgi:hypothetical protein
MGAARRRRHDGGTGVVTRDDGDPAVTGVAGATATVRVGVTGERRIDDPEAVAAAVRDALDRIGVRFAAGATAPADAQGQSDARLVAVSPLAEGADRIVARAILERPGGTLTVPLPFPRDEYVTDFASPASRAEFERLLKSAAHVEALPATATRNEGYEQAGRWVVDHSDVMLALWDGGPSRGRGGTAEIVAYARQKNVPVYWIHVGGGPVVVEEL